MKSQKSGNVLGLNDLEGYVFIVTYGRSGSTLLQNMLNAIPGYQIRGENNDALFHLVKSWASIVDSEPLRGLRNAGKETNQTHPWFGGENIFPDVYGASLADTFVKTVLQPDEGVRVSGFKEIRFHLHPAFFPRYLNFMHAYFPNARFVINTRDHKAVAKSGWWASRSFENVDKILNLAETTFEKYREANPDRCIHLHYDDYVKDVQAFRPLFEFLGETFDEKVALEVMGQRLEHMRGEGK
ncbi:hypothetical protein NBRC116590_31510 [Pelagimonas sp. KU-00592-HH]|uniref:sulfotransferase family protein n=1 Tax=Roseobacteraceae TaxID=2854170 RepID=UPI0020CD9F49|nr:sulfotransferase [Shimia sp. CNT1-13L.2]MCP9483589.1 sulfotransferase [Shimia sp. CNT1-13L.2]